jgi:FKBP-type peptidyl-prolyl cis-trans isomerase SlyD
MTMSDPQGRKIELEYKLVTNTTDTAVDERSGSVIYKEGSDNLELSSIIFSLKVDQKIILTPKVQIKPGGITMKISQDKVVSIDYILKVEGQIEDRSEPGDPLMYLHGRDNIISGLEKALEGHEVGDLINVTVTPEDGYGERDDENVQVLPRADFDDDIEVGASYFAQSDDGSVNPFTVVSVSGDDVTVDFNPPLAGKILNFEATVLEVRDATAEELDHGHPHGEGMHDDEDE